MHFNQSAKRKQISFECAKLLAGWFPSGIRQVVELFVQVAHAQCNASVQVTVYRFDLDKWKRQKRILRAGRQTNRTDRRNGVD